MKMIQILSICRKNFILIAKTKFEKEIIFQTTLLMFKSVKTTLIIMFFKTLKD